MSGFDRVEPEVAPEVAPDTGPADEYPPEWVGLLLDGLAAALRPATDPDPDTGDGAPDEEVLDPLFADPEQWVNGWFAPIVVRQPTQDFLWCAQWWDHAEVLTRITGLWETWEAARLGGATAINEWMATQLDHHLAVITAASGPFFRCKPAHGDTPGEHHTPAGLTTIPAPEGFFG